MRTPQSDRSMDLENEGVSQITKRQSRRESDTNALHQRPTKTPVIDIKPIPLSSSARSKSKSIFQREWRTTVQMIGFYISAWLCAIAHLCVFNYLDGRVLNESNENLPSRATSVPQTYVSTISLVLVTAFRAALGASIGVCFTQCMWRTFRSQILSVNAIENLFQVRANALRLLKPALVRYTPVLFMIAALSWLLPLAAIYPPGALIILPKEFQHEESFNVSVIPASGIPVPNYPQNITDDLGLAAHGFTYDHFQTDSSLRYLGPTEDLQTIANSVLLNTRIGNLVPSIPGNFSYNITILGPRMQCRYINSTRTNVIIEDQIKPSMETGPGDSKFYRLEFRLPFPLFQISGAQGTLRVIENSESVLATCPQISPKNSSLLELPHEFWILQSRKIKECGPAIAEYQINVTAIDGAQSVEYTTTTLRLIPQSVFDEQPLPSKSLERSLQTWFTDINMIALIDSMISIFPYQRNMTFTGNFSELYDNSSKTYRFDGIDVQVCELLWEYPSQSQSEGENKFFDEYNMYNFDISEELLNKALANITLSALALNNWYGLTNGTITRTMNTYVFEHSLNFYLPYGLALLLALPVLALGLYAMNYNGVSAIDGGFIQVLVTTTGNTELRDLAIQEGCISSGENVSEDLKNLKIRFGGLFDAKTSTTTNSDVPGDNAANEDENSTENHYRNHSRSQVSSYQAMKPHQSGPLIEDDPILKDTGQASGASLSTSTMHVVRRTGFGTVDETKPLKKGGGLLISE